MWQKKSALTSLVSWINSAGLLSRADGDEMGFVIKIFATQEAF